MTVDVNAPHASLKTDESASLRSKIGTHGRMPGTGSTCMPYKGRRSW